MQTITENPPVETAPPETVAEVRPPDTVREKTQAQYKFTVEELADLGTRLSRSRKDYSRIESELDSIKQDFKGKLSTVELEQDSLCRKLDDGFEMREATAIVTFNDPSKGRKTYRHEETGDVIREEPMTHSDWQLPMFKTPDGKDATAPVETLAANADVVPETADDRARNKEGAPEFLNTADGEGTKEDLGRILDVPNAGETPLDVALDAAALKSEQPRIVIQNFGLDDWTPGGLIKAFRAAAKKAGWPEAAISAFRSQLFPLDTIAAMKDMLRPHVVTDAPPFADIIEAAKTDYPDGLKLRAHFQLIIKHYPSQYPGGNGEPNFTKFQTDIADAIEAEVQESRTAEDAAQ